MLSLWDKNGFFSCGKPVDHNSAIMSFLPNAYQISKEDIDNHLKEFEPGEVIPYYIYLMIDYAFHHNDADYRQGLSFFHRINDKLGKYEQRTLDMLEIFVNDDKDYVHMLNALFNEEDLAYYGI
jgi:hypothetical protein